MSFIWRTGVTDTTPPGLSNTGLLTIRIVMTVVLGIGVVYGFLIMTTFQRYGAVMDKAWKQRIDDWIAEKATGNRESFPQRTPDDLPYIPPQRFYPDRSYNRPLHQPSFGDFTGYPPYRYPPAYAPQTYVPAHDTGSPRRGRRPPSPNYASRNHRPGRNQTPVNTSPYSYSPHPDFQDDGGMTSATRIPSPGATPPPLNPKGPAATAEVTQFPPGFVPVRYLSPILESPSGPSEGEDNALGISSGLENRITGGDHAPEDGNHVRFRLPSGRSGSSDSSLLSYA